MRASGLFDQVQNGDAGDWTDAGTWLFDHRYQLSPGGRRPSASRAAGLREAIDETLSLLGTPAGNADQAAARARPDRRDAAHRRRR